MKLYSKHIFNKFYLTMFGYNNEKPNSIVGYFFGWLLLIVLFPLYINMYITFYKDGDINLGFQLLFNLILIFALIIIFSVIGIFFNPIAFMSMLPYMISAFYITPIVIKFISNFSKKTKMEWYDEREDDEQFEKFEN